jgi:undecaprenyl-diphosphatase
VIFVSIMAVAALLANEFLVEPLKSWIQRPRPFLALNDTILRVPAGTPRASMPSGHAMNAFLAATIVGWYYPRFGVAAMLIAAGVAVSRVYNGVHYPSDVLVGSLLGLGAGAFCLWVAERFWQQGVPRCAQLQRQGLHSLLRPEARPPVSVPKPGS